MIAGAGASVTTWLVAILATLCASMIVRTTSAALVLGLAFTFARPLIGLGVRAIYDSLLGNWSPLSLTEMGLCIVAFLALGAAIIRRSRLRAFLAVSGALLLILASVAPLVVSADYGAMRFTWAAAFLVAGIAGVGLAVRGVRQSRGMAAMTGLFLALIALPCLLTIGADEGDAATALLSGTAFLALAGGVAVEGDRMPISGPLSGIVQDLIVLLSLGAVFLPRLERWLGRAA